MKITQMFLMAAMAATLALAGCGKSNDVNTSALESSFKASEPATQTVADKAVAAIKSSDYAGALTQLQSLAAQAKLTPEQQQAIKDVMAQVQKVMTDAAGKAVGDATKAAGDASKATRDMPNPLKK